MFILLAIEGDENNVKKNRIVKDRPDLKIIEFFCRVGDGRHRENAYIENPTFNFAATVLTGALSITMLYSRLTPMTRLLYGNILMPAPVSIIGLLATYFSFWNSCTL